MESRRRSHPDVARRMRELRRIARVERLIHIPKCRVVRALRRHLAYESRRLRAGEAMTRSIVLVAIVTWLTGCANQLEFPEPGASLSYAARNAAGCLRSGGIWR